MDEMDDRQGADLCSTPSTKLAKGSARAKWITSRISILVSAYRRDDFSDPEGFAVQVGMVLAAYPDCIVETVTSPLTGIQRRCIFPPSIAEIVSACEAQQISIAKAKRYMDMPTPNFTRRITGPPKPRYNLFVPSTAIGFETMCVRAKTADPKEYRLEDGGIHVPITWWWERGVGLKQPEFRQFSVADLREMYARNDAQTAREGHPLSE